MKSVFIISVSLVSGVLGHKSYEGCSVAGMIDNDLIQAAFLSFDHFITYRAKLSNLATLTEGLYCLDPARTAGDNSSKPLSSLRFGILDSPVNDTSHACSFPVSVFTGYDGLKPSDTPECTPSHYRTNPWACAPGDWSGKFGGMDLGLSGIAKNVTDDPAPVEIREELKVHYDPLGIPTCLLDGRKLAVFCADGSVAGCTTLRVISKGSPKKGIWAGMKFFSDHAPLGGCEAGGSPATYKIAKKNGENERFSPKLSRAIVTNWWEEFRKRSSDLWQKGKGTTSDGKVLV